MKELDRSTIHLADAELLERDKGLALELLSPLLDIRTGMENRL